MLALGLGHAHAVAAQAQPTIGVDEIERGQKGYGLSVFTGQDIERFDLEVLGVLRNSSPDIDYIMARLDGQGLSDYGVIAGMSGSPVFIDDRLAGAVAFSWTFANEPIAGITPIEAMRSLSEADIGGILSWTGLATNGAAGQLRPRSWSDASLFEVLSKRDPDAALETLRATLATLQPKAARSGTSSGLQVSTGGFDTDLLDLLGARYAMAAGTGRNESLSTELSPGSAVAGLLVDGDLRMAVTGTVTDRIGDDVLAMGHPYLGIGALNIPMASAEVITIVPTELESFKLTNVGPVVGSFVQDRLAGLRGIVGRVPERVPLSIEISGLADRRYELLLADMADMAAGLVGMSVAQTLDAASYISGRQTVELEARFDLADRDDLVVRQVFAGGGAGVGGAVYLLLITDFLARNPFEPVDVEGISVAIEQRRGDESATLVSAYADHTQVEPGESVDLHLTFRSYRGEPFRRTVSYTVAPDQSPGTLYLFVGDGPSVDGTRLKIEPESEKSLDQALEHLSAYHASDELVVMAVEPGRGLVTSDISLPQLPDSIRSVLSSGSTFGGARLSLARRGEVVVSLEHPIEGLERIDLTVLSRQKGSP